MDSSKIVKFTKSYTFVLTALQELLPEEIAKNFTTYSRLFDSDNFRALSA